MKQETWSQFDQSLTVIVIMSIYTPDIVYNIASTDANLCLCFDTLIVMKNLVLKE